jgi:predicted translin family RNA/ssDNA-binding protein
MSDELTASIAEKTRTAMDQHTLERKVVRYSKDAAMFAKQGKMRDARRALYKAALALEAWEAMP